MESFADRLERAVREKQSACLLGLDPHLALLPDEYAVARAADAGASRYCMVLSGRGPSVAATRKLAEVIRGVKERFPIEVCLSVGLLEEEHARILADAGLDRLNHNLNTSAIAALQGEFKGIELDIERLIGEMQKSIDESEAFIRTLKS